MSRNNSFPPIQKPSSNIKGTDLAGEMTIDQFLLKYSQLSAPKKEEYYASRTPSPMAAARAASNTRRTSIRRIHSGKAGVRTSQSPEHGAASGGGGVGGLTRSEQALLLTEHSAVLLDDLPPAVGSDDTMSNGDSARSTDRSGWQAGKFQQSPSPDNRRGDKPPPPRRKSLLERWEEVQAQQRPRPPSAGGSSTDSQFEDDAYPYRPRLNTRGISQETGFEPTQGDEAAQRPSSGVDSLATPRSGPRPPSSSSTGASSARSDVSDRTAAQGHSLFDSGNIETIDDVIESLLSSRAAQTPKPRHKARVRSADSSWDQVDRSSHPVIETVRFPELVKAPSPPAVNEYERYGSGQPRPAASATQVLERLSQVMSTQRTQRGATQTRDEEAPPPPAQEAREEAGSQRPPSGRGPAVLRSPRTRPMPVHRAHHAAPRASIFSSRRASQPSSAAAGWHSSGPPKPPRLSARRASLPPAAAISSADQEGPPAAPAVPGWLEPEPEDAGTDRQTAAFELEPGGGRVVGAASPDLGRPPRQAFCVASPGLTAPGSRALADELDGLVDPTLTQRLMWRQILKWTAVTSSVLVSIALTTLVVLLLL